MRILQTHFCVLDIETSTHYIDGKPVLTWLSFGVIRLYDLQFNVVESYSFREWIDLGFILKDIERKFYKYEIICYCHNLSFEYDFLMKNIGKPCNIISNSSRGIIAGKIEGYNFQFKCSYRLTGKSLAKLGEIVKLPKLEAEYINIFPHEKIPPEYLEYCERDCDVVAKYIIEQELPVYGTLRKIPFTKTGKVRRYLHEYYRKYEGKNCEWDLMPDEDCFQALLDSFQGAITISNPMFTNIKLNNLNSYDIKSSYPYQMLLHDFPYDIKKSLSVDKSQIKENRFWIAKIRFKNIVSKHDWQWLSLNKINDFCKRSCIFFNGKLIDGEWIERTITNVDFELINKTYQYEDFEILEFYTVTKWGKIPLCYRDTILHFSNEKHRLGLIISDMEKHEISEFSEEYMEVKKEYMTAKENFNAIYGMTVQKLMQPEFWIDDNFIWQERDINYKQDKNKHMKRNFLFGIYILAYARKSLIDGILENCPHNFVYADTDSIKYLDDGKPFIDTNIPLSGMYAEIESVKELGKFECEGKIDEFKTLGAKKYCYTRHEELHIVVAGLPKNERKLLTCVDDFKPNTNFENCKLGKAYMNSQNATYLDWETYELLDYGEISEEIRKFLDKHKIVSNGGIALYPTSYLLNMTNEDKFLINEYQRMIPHFIKKYPQYRRNIYG